MLTSSEIIVISMSITPSSQSQSTLITIIFEILKLNSSVIIYTLMNKNNTSLHSPHLLSVQYSAVTTASAAVAVDTSCQR